MKDVKLGSTSHAFWLIGMELDVTQGSIIVTLGKSPDSEKVSHTLFFDGLANVGLDYSDEMDSNYRSTLLGLVTDVHGRYILTTDVFEISFKAQKFRIEE
jgi:hypothetical protein